MVIYELTTLRCPFDDLSSQQANHSIESGVRPSLCRKVNISTHVVNNNDYFSIIVGP